MTVPAALFGQRHANLRLFLGAVAISFSAVFVKLVSVPPSVSAFYRMLIGGAVLAVWLAGAGRLIRPTPPAGRALFVAALFFAADLVAWHQSIVYIGPGLATLLGNFQVFFMALAGILLFKERLGRPMLFALPLAVAGLAMITGFDWTGLSEQTRHGILLGLLTAVFYTGFMLGMRRAQVVATRRDAAADLAYVCLLCGALLLVFALWRGDALAVGSWRDGVFLVLYALVSQVLGWVLITSALTQVPVSRVGLVLLLQPALSFAWDIAFFGRAFSALEAGGAALALVAIYLGARPPRETRI